MMRFEDCFRLLHERLKTELIVTSAGNTSELWWEISRETERVFYLEASMSLASLFAAGIALRESREDGRGVQRRRRLQHESRNAVCRTAIGFAQSQALHGFEPLLRLDQRAHHAVQPFHRLCRDGAGRGALAGLFDHKPGRPRPAARRDHQGFRSHLYSACMSSRSAAMRCRRLWTDRRSNSGSDVTLSALAAGPFSTRRCPDATQYDLQRSAHVR